MNEEEQQADKGLAAGHAAELPAIIIHSDSNLEPVDDEDSGDLTNVDPLTDYLSPDRMTVSSDGSSIKFDKFAVNSGPASSQRTCSSRPNAALKPACTVDTELERTITRAIMSRRVAAETAGLLEDVLEQQTNSPSSSPVSPSSSATQQASTANDPAAQQGSAATITNCSSAGSLRTLRASVYSSTLDATRQGVSLKHFEPVESSLEKSGENSDGVRRILNKSSNNSIEPQLLDRSTGGTVLTQNTVRVHGTSIKTSNYSARQVPDRLKRSSKEPRDFSSIDDEESSSALPADRFIEAVLDSSQCARVKNQKTVGICASAERKLRKEPAVTSDEHEQATDAQSPISRTVSGSSLINFIDSTIGDSSDELTAGEIRAKSASPDDVFGNESFLDCPNLVVNCDLANDLENDTQNSNSSAFLVNPLASNSSLLLATVDSTDLANELLAGDLIKSIDEPQQASSAAIQLSGQSNQPNQANPAEQSSSRNQNNNNLLTTVLFISESSEPTNDERDSTTGVNDSFDSGRLVRTSLAGNSPQSAPRNSTTTLLISDSLPRTESGPSRTALTAGLPINARVLLIENLAQLSEFASGQNIILTAPLLQKPADSTEKTRSSSSVISRCPPLVHTTSTPAEPSSKRVKKLRRQFAVDDSDSQQAEPKDKPAGNAQPKSSDHVLVIKELNTVDSRLESSGDLVESSGGAELSAANDPEKRGKADEEHAADPKSEEEEVKTMLDATDFRGVLNAAAVLNAGLNAVAEHQSSYQLNGRLTPPGYGQHSAQSQLASQQYATLQPLPPISTMSDKFHDKFAHHYVLNSGNHGNSSSSAGNQSVIGASNCASNAVHPGFALMPNTTLGKR